MKYDTHSEKAHKPTELYEVAFGGALDERGHQRGQKAHRGGADFEITPRGGG